MAIDSYKDVETVKFGEHLIVDAYGCNPDKLEDKEFCLNILNSLVALTDMKKLMEPYIVKAEENETLGGKDPGGFSCFVMIQESHISMHTFARRMFVTLDIYSCKEFDSSKVIPFLKEQFETNDIDVIKFDRGLKYPKENLF